MVVLKDAKVFVAKITTTSETCRNSSPVNDPSDLPVNVLSDLPVGGYMTVRWERSSAVGSQVPGEQVWAAQYVQLDARYFHSEQDLPNHIPLLEKKTSTGHTAQREESGSSVEEAPGVKEPNTAVLAVDEWDHFRQVVEDCEKEMNLKDAERNAPVDQSRRSSSISDRGSYDLPPARGKEIVGKCDGCERSIRRMELHYHCEQCDGGDFDLCQICVSRAVTCGGIGHELRRRRV